MLQHASVAVQQINSWDIFDIFELEKLYLNESFYLLNLPLECHILLVSLWLAKGIFAQSHSFFIFFLDQESAQALVLK